MERVWSPSQEKPEMHFDWSIESLFGNKRPVHLEYCSGDGGWIATRAIQQSDCNWVAVERKPERVAQIRAKIEQFNLSNLIVIAAEALFITESCFPSHSIAAAYINFPDPWPKRRHAKYRLINALFVAQLARLLSPGGAVTAVTDCANYSTSIISLFTNNPAFDSLFPPSHYTSELEGYGTSRFETRWRNRGCEIRYHIFKRRDDGH